MPERCTECDELIHGVSYSVQGLPGPYCWRCYACDPQGEDDEEEERENAHEREMVNRIAVEVDHE